MGDINFGLRVREDLFGFSFCLAFLELYLFEIVIRQSCCDRIYERIETDRLAGGGIIKFLQRDRVYLW